MAHCASSNFNLMSGVMDVRAFVKDGIKLSIGTDVAGGHSPSMLDAIRQTILASRIQALKHNEDVEEEVSTAYHDHEYMGLFVWIWTFRGL